MQRLRIAILLPAMFITFGLMVQAQDWQGESDPPLLPLTAEEQKLDPRKIIAEQPDFVADQEGDYVGGSRHAIRFKRKIAKSGNRFAVIDDFRTTVTDLGKSVLSMNGNEREYEFLTIGNFEDRHLEDCDFRELLSLPKATFSIRGRRVMYGRSCLEIEISNIFQDDAGRKLWLLADPQAQNLIIAFRSFNKHNVTQLHLSNISFKPPMELFEIPPGYSEIKKIEWKRIKSARVFFGSTFDKDAFVFQNQNGELFVSVSEPHPNTGSPYPWTYLVFEDGEKGIRVDAPAGMETVVTASGDLLSATDDVGFSREFLTPDSQEQGDEVPQTDSRPPTKKSDGPKPRGGIQDGKRWVEFPSLDYRTNRTIIRIEWDEAGIK
jgi:hypothetical protein